MKKRKIIVPLLLMLFGITSVKAQQVVVASGGNAAGSGGSISYSVGQNAYKNPYRNNWNGGARCAATL